MIDHHSHHPARSHHHRGRPGGVRPRVAEVAGDAPRGRHDTKSWHHALKNTPAPGARRLIGEIRDAEDHGPRSPRRDRAPLCTPTAQPDERIIISSRKSAASTLMDLSANHRSIVSQRLVRREDDKGRSAARDPAQPPRRVQEDHSKASSARSRPSGVARARRAPPTRRCSAICDATSSVDDPQRRFGERAAPEHR